MLDISEIKLIRTDTTLDLSQKAEKVCHAVDLSMRRCMNEDYLGAEWSPPPPVRVGGPLGRRMGGGRPPT